MRRRDGRKAIGAGQAATAIDDSDDELFFVALTKRSLPACTSFANNDASNCARRRRSRRNASSKRRILASRWASIVVLFAGNDH